MHTRTVNAPAQQSAADRGQAVARNTRDSSLEQRAHDQLITALGSGNPDRLRRCIEVIRELFNADSAGLHIVPTAALSESAGLDVLCGVLDSQEQAHARIGSGLAKLCASARAPIVLCEQEIELTYLRHLRPRIVHVLMAPIYDDQQFLGTVWLAQVSSTLTYSRADTLVLHRVTHDLALGLKVLEREQEQAAQAVRLQTQCASLGEALSMEQQRREQAERVASESDKARSHAMTLLNEAHHRVKNTLQVSCSLLSLQAHATSSDSTRAALRQATERLKLVLHVHQLLYDPERNSKLIPATDLLNVVITSQMRGLSEAGKRITLHAVSDEVMMSTGECTTLMIIVNELVTNAYKHAFPDDMRGSITVELKTERDALVLRVADSGAGMSKPIGTKHFGLTLVQSLVDQLGGTFTIANSPSATGTVVTLTIPDAGRHVSPQEMVAPSVRRDNQGARVMS
ncbi:MAG TPA: sensor histidine kinase [Steroidobacteraceae bacterium]|nr:sensor histidine kinase [Steroidobacteraceae bacterium]